MPKTLMRRRGPQLCPIVIGGHYQLHTAAESFCRWNCSQLITSRDLIAAQYAPSTLAGSTPSRSAASFAERFSSPQITNAKRQKISSLAQTTLDSSSRTVTPIRGQGRVSSVNAASIACMRRKVEQSVVAGFALRNGSWTSRPMWKAILEDWDFPILPGRRHRQRMPLLFFRRL